MSLAGMNDRDNTNNENRYNALASSYGMSEFKPKKKVVDKVGSSGGGELPVFFYHKNGYPEKYKNEFERISESLIKLVQKEKGVTYFSYSPLMEQANEYIQKAVDLTCKAYDIKSLEFDELDSSGVVKACTYPRKRALSIIEDIFCSRGEALSSLSIEEREMLCKYKAACEQYEQDSVKCKEKIKELKRHLNTWKEMISSYDGEVPDKALTMYHEIIEESDEEKRHLETIDAEYKSYRKEFDSKVSKIWNKVRFYDPK